MQILSIRPSKLGGNCTVPPSKSHTMRALILATLSEGTCAISNPLQSPDTEAMIQACKQFGAIIESSPDTLKITGTRGHINQPRGIIHCGNSGQVLRFGSVFAALCDQPVTIDGDDSIRLRRCMQAVISGIQQLGGHAQSHNRNDRAPLNIHGPCHAGQVTVDGRYAQPISTLLLLATQLQGTSHINAINVLEPSWIQLTLDWLASLNIAIEQTAKHHYCIQGKQSIPAFERRIPADFSQTGYALVAAIIQQQPLSISNLDFNDSQGDKQLLTLLANSGIELNLDNQSQCCHFSGHGQLRGGRYNIADFNDALPIFAVLACFAASTVEIVGAHNTQFKESNRLSAIQLELSKMRASITVTHDGLIIEPRTLQGAVVHSHNDHRIAMALAMAGCCCQSGETLIEQSQCIEKSYPRFCEAMSALGADMKTLLRSSR